MSRNLWRGCLLMLAFKAGNALACATCLCGDPTITTMGTEKPFAGRTRMSIEYLTRGETVGVPAVSEHVIDEQRLTYSLSYAINEQWIIAASMPVITKQVNRFDLTQQQASGLGDMDLTARAFIGTDNRFPVRQLWGLQFGLRVPTSSEQQVDGQSIDFDAQPGAGATIPSIGAWYGYYRTPWFLYASATYQHATSEGYQGYQAGDVLLLTGMTQYAIHPKLALQLSVDARWKAQDKYADVRDGDSGGTLVMASPGMAWTMYDDLIMNISYQVPLIENVHGRQEEAATFRIGVLYDF
jgi:Putative MetA-pathway of phenol degradation